MSCQDLSTQYAATEWHLQKHLQYKAPLPMCEYTVSWAALFFTSCKASVVCFSFQTRQQGLVMQPIAHAHVTVIP